MSPPNQPAAAIAGKCTGNLAQIAARPLIRSVEAADSAPGGPKYRDQTRSFVNGVSSSARGTKHMPPGEETILPLRDKRPETGGR